MSIPADEFYLEYAQHSKIEAVPFGYLLQMGPLLLFLNFPFLYLPPTEAPQKYYLTFAIPVLLTWYCFAYRMAMASLFQFPDNTISAMGTPASTNVKTPPVRVLWHVNLPSEFSIIPIAS